MRILFASGSMQGGGAERVISVLANEFVNHNIDISILVVRGGSVYPLDTRIKLITVYSEDEMKDSLANKLWRRLIFYPRLIKNIYITNPSIIIPVHGGGWNGLFIILSKILNIKSVACENTSHTHLSHNFIRRLERHFIYRFADAVSVLTKFDSNYYAKFLKNVVHIPNPVGFKINARSIQRKKIILAAGRLDSWKIKGFDSLLQAFSNCADKHQDWNLHIAGDGDNGKEFLSQMIQSLGLTGRVKLLGFCPDIDTKMRECDIFVLSSRHEGFAMVLAEAMSQGMACISFDCEAGPADIIDHEVNGLLVPNQDITALSSAISRLITECDERILFSSNGIKKIEQFSPTVIVDRWLKLFSSFGLSIK